MHVASSKVQLNQIRTIKNVCLLSPYIASFSLHYFCIMLLWYVRDKIANEVIRITNVNTFECRPQNSNKYFKRMTHYTILAESPKKEQSIRYIIIKIVSLIYLAAVLFYVFLSLFANIQQCRLIVILMLFCKSLFILETDVYFRLWLQFPNPFATLVFDRDAATVVIIKCVSFYSSQKLQLCNVSPSP